MTNTPPSYTPRSKTRRGQGLEAVNDIASASLFEPTMADSDFGVRDMR